MERSEYFNYTRPSETQLNNTEDSKIRGILRRARSNFQFGIRIGFRVTINAANNTQIDIGPGDGFTGGFYESENLRGSPNSGERISTLTDAATGEAGYVATVTGLGLVDYSANAKNYICLKYVEATSIPLAERYYPFTTHNTIVDETYQAEVYTEAQWNALTTNELEQRVLIAVVTAQGAGNALSLANIQQMVQPKSHPIAGTQPSNITGVTITGVSDETLIGNGILRFEVATKKLYWTAPGDAEGTGVVINSSGTFTIYSDDTSYWIFVEIIFASLPAANSSDIIGIESLYGRVVPMACAVDQAHRDMLGTGVISETNPHGISIDDITGGTFDHAELFHVNGISSDAEDDQLQCSLDMANDEVDIVNNGGSRNSFLIDGITYETLAGLAAGADGSVSFDVVPALDSGDYLIYIDSSGTPQRVKIAEYAPGGPADTTVLWSANIQIYDIYNETAGQGRIDWDNATGELYYTAPGDAAGTHVNVLNGFGFGQVQEYGFYKLYSNNGTDWIIVFVDGDLGATNNSTFNIDKNETDHPDDSMLKIGIVTWNAIGEILANLRDIRRFNTADNREQIEEEHDEDGRHTKVLQYPLRVAIASDVAFHARASGDTGAFGHASTDVGVYGYAEESIGVKGIAGTDYGGYFSAAESYGAYGTADTIGLAGVAQDVTGVYGAAPTLGGDFAAANTAVRGVAAVDIGGSFGAVGDTAIMGDAGDDVGVRGSAGDDFGGVFIADGNTGCYGSAGADYGVYGLAVNDYGVYGTADSYGVYGTAVANYGGWFRCGGAAGTGLLGWANAAVGGEIGVYGTAAGATGVAGEAGGGACTGVYGAGAGAAAIGVYGTGGPTGGYGVYGTAASVGVCGSADSAGGVGVQGFNNNADGTGGQFSAGALGLSVANYIRYDITKEDTNAYHSGVPIIIGGNTYVLALYTTV